MENGHESLVMLVLCMVMLIWWVVFYDHDGNSYYSDTCTVALYMDYTHVYVGFRILWVQLVSKCAYLDGKWTIQINSMSSKFWHYLWEI